MTRDSDIGIEDLSADRTDLRFILPPLFICVIALWLVPIWTSLGLDESGAWWVVKDGLREAVVRNHFWPGSILFDGVLVGARNILGDGDYVLRIPSVMASLGTLWVLYSLGARMFDRLSGAFGCLVFVAMPEVIGVASTARPYALGLLFVTVSVWALVNWFDTGRLSYAIMFSLSAALSLYCHYFFGVMAGVYLAYARFRFHRERTRVRLRQFFIFSGIAGLISLPLIPLFLGVMGEAGRRVFLPTPDFESLLLTLIPTSVVGGIALAALLRLATREPIAVLKHGARSEIWLLGVWSLLPILLMFGISVFTQLKVFTSRCYIAAAPALALLGGALIRSLSPAAFRRLIASTITVISILIVDVNGKSLRGADDWRGAAQALAREAPSGNVPVLAVSGFIEAQDKRAVLDPVMSDVLYAPFLRYFRIPNLIRLPIFLNQVNEPYLEAIASTTLLKQRQFYLVGLDRADGYEDWLRGRCFPYGFRTRSLGDFGGVRIVVFERKARSDM